MNNSITMRELFENAREASPIEIYLSANDSAVFWLPARMQPVHEANPRYVKQCDKYLVDSSFNKPEIANRDVLNTAHRLWASGCLLEDVYQDFEATVQRLTEGQELASDHAFDGRVIYPLQAPYVDCWEAINKPDHIAIGGLKDASDDDRIEAIMALRNAGHTGTIHGLGWGVSDKLARFVRANPDMLDSVDSRSPQTQAMTHNNWPGIDVSRPMALHSAAYLLESYRKCGLADDPYETTTLGDFA